MAPAALKGYLDRSGLESEDVPKVIGTFVTAKYGTYAAAIALGIRYQPLRKVFLTRSQALGGESAGGALRSWAVRQHPRILEAVNRARNNRVRATKDRFGQALDTARKQMDTARSNARSRYQNARSRYKDARGRWNTAGRELLNRQQQQLQKELRLRALPRREQVFAGGWYAWSSAKYWQITEKLEKAATRSRVWCFIGSALRIKPRALALGLAEGTILNKLTFPLYGPLYLWLIVEVYRRRRSSLATCAETPDDSGRADVTDVDTCVE